MNFLAHSFLSGSLDDRLVGNLMGDFVKGRHRQGLSLEFMQGIDLHRRIDSFTDTHPVVRQSKSRLFPTYRHYAGVIVDLYYDHFLAANWTSYSPTPLADFSQQVYQLLHSRKELLPKSMQGAIFYMYSQNWFLSYASLEGIERALEGVSRRTRFKSDMEYAIRDLKKDYAFYQEEFELYFPQLIQYVSVLKGQLTESLLS